jgi:adenine deaminase
VPRPSRQPRPCAPLQVAFLPLPVIPHLKITDMGLVDVDKFEFVRD